MEDIKPNVVKIYRNSLLIHQGNDIDTWNKMLEPGKRLDTGHGCFIHMIENTTK